MESLETKTDAFLLGINDIRFDPINEIGLMKRKVNEIWVEEEKISKKQRTNS